MRSISNILFVTLTFICLYTAKSQTKAFDEYAISKNFSPVTSYQNVVAPSSATVNIELDLSQTIYPVRQSLFGHNAVAWQGNVNETNNAHINYNNANFSFLRYPGGNWSNIFFWDNNLPASVKTDGVVTGTGSLKAGNTSWFLGTDEFPDLLTFTGAQGIVCVNVGWAFYGTDADPVATAAQYAADWVNYYNNTLGLDIKYWELGNENYGSWQAGYSFADAFQYGDACKEFYDAMKAVDSTIEIGVVLYEGDGGLHTNSENGKDWNERILPIVEDHMDFAIIHQYPHPNNNRNNISEADIYEASSTIEEVVDVIHNQVDTYTSKPADHYPICITEYNARTGVRELSRTNALFTTLMLGEMAKHNVGGAMQWSLNNGWKASDGSSHGAISSKDPFMNDGDANAELYVFYFMDKYFGDTIISSTSSNTDIVVYPTTFSSGEVGATIVNIGTIDQTVEIDLLGGKEFGNRFYWYTINGDDDDFDRTIYINGVGPSNSFVEGNSYCNNSDDCVTATTFDTNGVGGPQNYTSILPNSSEVAPTNNAFFLSPKHSVSYVVFETVEEQVVAVVNNETVSGISVFPNPSYGNKVHFSVTLHHVEIADSFGKIIKTATSLDQLDTSDFPKGLYIIGADEGQIKLLIH